MESRSGGGEGACQGEGLGGIGGGRTCGFVADDEGYGLGGCEGGLEGGFGGLEEGPQRCLREAEHCDGS